MEKRFVLKGKFAWAEEEDVMFTSVVGNSVVVVGKSVMNEVGNSVMVVGKSVMEVGISVGTDKADGHSTDGTLVALKLGRPVAVPRLEEIGAGTELTNRVVSKGWITGDAVGRRGRTDSAFAIFSSPSFIEDRLNRPSIPSAVKAAPATTMLPPTTIMAAFIGRLEVVALPSGVSDKDSATAIMVRERVEKK